jgi:hypothetical protein
MNLFGLSLSVFLGLIVCLELGFRYGRREIARRPESATEGVGSIEAAVFALLGLLLAFSLSGATGRLDYRRQLIVQEANAIGTAYLRLDLLPPAEQLAIRQLFRSYLDARLHVYQLIARSSEIGPEMARVTQLQGEIWARVVAASRQSSDQAAERLLLPAINDMIDITTSRTIALNTHLPAPITQLIVAVALISGLIAGYGMAKRKSRSWIHIFLYAALVAVTLHVIMDLEYPRSGLIRLDAADQALMDLRDSIQ